jgi:hypothetical protein
MNSKKTQQMETKINLLERQLTFFEKANAQLEGTVATFTLVFAAIAIKHGGKVEITAEEIDAAGGRQIQMRKHDEEQTLTIEVIEELAKPEPLKIYDPDESKHDTEVLPPPPSKLQNPFIMEEEGLNPPGMGQSQVKLTDL